MQSSVESSIIGRDKSLGRIRGIRDETKANFSETLRTVAVVVLLLLLRGKSCLNEGTGGAVEWRGRRGRRRRRTRDGTKKTARGHLLSKQGGCIHCPLLGPSRALLMIMKEKTAELGDMQTSNLAAGSPY